MELPDALPPQPANRRQHYRIAALRGETLIADLILSDGMPRRAEVVNVSHGGSALRLPRAVAGEILDGEECRVCYRFGEGGRPILLQGRLLARQDEGETFRLRVQFLDAERLTEILHPSAWRVFNRRQSYRVAPRDDESIDVAVGWRKEKRVSALIDISVSGLAVRVPWDDDESLAVGEVVAVSFRLPDDDTPIVGITTLRNVYREKGALRFGLEFDIEKSQGWVLKERRIVEYLMRRQREDLQELCEREAERDARRHSA